MSRVLMLVEGPTERSIVDRVLAPALAVKGVYLYPRVVGKPGHKGGNKFATVRRELKALIHQEPGSAVTTLFDYYGLPKDWPGVTEAEGKRPGEVPGIIEPAILAAIAEDIGPAFNSSKFIPYIQLHEIESLLFSGPEEMAHVFENSALSGIFGRIVRDCGGYENIDNDPENAPSKRIQKLFPGYKKGSSANAHAYRIAQRIGVEQMRTCCPHFNEWLVKLEQLG
jgi:hypothetical protein